MGDVVEARDSADAQRHSRAGPVKAWIEPDRWAFVRAFPLQAASTGAALLLSFALAVGLHPIFWSLAVFAWFRHAAAEASLRELWREGMLHPARVLSGAASGLIATLVRLEGERGVQDAVVISRIPRRWGKLSPPWGGERAAVVIAGQPPRLKPLSADFAVGDLERARRATERIPEPQWEALSRALGQLPEVSEGVHPVQLGEEPWYGSLREVEAEGSLPVVPDSAQSHVWCAGLPCIEEPEMVVAERTRVQGFRRRAWLRVLSYAACTALLPAGFVVLVAYQELARDRALSFVVLAGLFAFVLTPFALLAMLSWFSRVRAYGRDLRQGRVMRFAGMLSSFDSLGLDPDLAHLTRRGLMVAEPGVEQELVVLPESRELLYANGKWAPLGLVLSAERVAMPPESPLRVALPEDVEAQAAEALAVARRRLTAAEIEELGRHVQALRVPGRVFWVLLGFACLAGYSWRLQDFALPPRPLTIPFMLLAFMFAALLLWRRVRLSNRLQRDAELGWVLTVDHAPTAPEGDTDLPAQGVETLLHGQLDWTVNRRPAAWRRFGVRRRA
ncbi:MAG: hypothetical protein QM778_35545 [Myxococcales bacterium]